jgi:hypothetical protein
MRVPILTAVAAAVALIALPAAAHGWVEDRDGSVVMVRECPLPAPTVYHRHVSHVVSRSRHGAVRCQVAAVTAPVEERIVRVYHHEDMDAWRGDHDRCDGDRCGDRDRDEGWRDGDHDRRGADGDRDMYEDHGMAMRHDEHEDHDMAMRHDEGDRHMSDDRGRAFVDGAVHHEDEDRRGWDDHQYAQREGGMHWDSGEARSHVYYEQRERTFEHGEHWVETCGCGPVRPTATDEYGYLVWAGKVAPPDEPDAPSWDVHP